MELPALAAIEWSRCYRLIPSHFPPIGIFDQIVDADELEWLHQIEAMTNDRLRQEMGQLDLVPHRDRVVGPGTTPIMAAFTHIHPDGSRFTDGSFGAYYAANSIETAIAETRYHRQRFLKATEEPACEITQRCYISTVIEALRDVRDQQAYGHLHDPDDYSQPQAFGRDLKQRQEWGILFQSVRNPGGECVAIFRPPALTPVIQGPHYAYVWNGERITWVYQRSNAKRFAEVEQPPALV